MGEFDGRTALITGGARGQGRSHALRLASEGANIALVDICEHVETTPQRGSSKEDLQETVRLVEDQGVRALAIRADVRSPEEMQEAADTALREFGQIDYLVANAGVMTMKRFDEMTVEEFQVQVDVLFHGVANAIRAVLPSMRERRFGRIVATGSAASISGMYNLSAYGASKWAVSGLIKSIALEVAKEGINLNVVAPITVNSDLVHNEGTYKACRPDLENPTKEDVLELFSTVTELPIPYIEPIDVSHAVQFLLSDRARYISGTVLDVMAGFNARTNH
jgi:SDR family mycofactocin-dependent oxidoreductase